MYQGEECCLSEIGVRFDEDNFTRNMFLHYKDVDSMRARFNNTGISESCFKYNTENIAESLLYGDFYIDLDSKEGFSPVREDGIKAISLLKVLFGINEKNIKIYFSGKKGIHIIVPAEILGVTPIKELDIVYKKIGIEIAGYLRNKTLDTQMYERRRLLRMVNSIHDKSLLYKIPLTLEELLRDSIEDIKAKATKPRTINAVKTTTTVSAHKSYEFYVNAALSELTKKDNTRYEAVLDYDPPCITNIMETPCGQGNRNYYGAILASHFKARGMTIEQAKDALTEWNNNNCSPKQPDKIIKDTIRSIFNSNKRYGCTSLSQTGGCNKTECKFCNK